MSTTTWQAPCRSVSSRPSRSLGRCGGQPGLDHDRLAEDAGRLGQRHRRLALHRRALAQVRVVVGVAELVGEGLHAVGRAVEVEHHPRLAAPDRQAERAALLARSRLGVDPLVAGGPFDERGERRRVAAEGIGDPADGVGPAHPAGRCVADRREQVVPREALPWPVTERSGLGPQVAVEVGQRGDHRLLHRVERRPIDAVGEQRRLEGVAPPAAAVQHDGLALGPVEGGGQRDGHRVPRLQLGLVRGPAPLGIGTVGQAPHDAHRAGVSRLPPRFRRRRWPPGP